MEPNLLPLIDVTFLLVIFFLLVHHLVGQDSVPMQLPQVSDTHAWPLDEQGRRTVHVLLDHVQAGPMRFGLEDVQSLGDYLAGVHVREPQVPVVLRADARLDYQQVQPILQAMTNAGITQVLVAAAMPGAQP